jgi:hypothetical protein
MFNGFLFTNILGNMGKMKAVRYLHDGVGEYRHRFQFVCQFSVNVYKDSVTKKCCFTSIAAYWGADYSHLLC